MVLVGLLSLSLLGCRPKYQRELAKRLADFEYVGDLETPNDIRALEKKIAFYKTQINIEIAANQKLAYQYELLGILYMNYKMYGLAAENYAKALEIFPANPVLHEEAASAYHVLGENTVDDESQKGFYLKAESHYMRAIKNSPTQNADYYEGLATLYLPQYLNNPQKSLPIIDKWISSTEFKDKPRFAKAQALTAVNRLQEAEALYSKLSREAEKPEDRELAQVNRSKVLNWLNF